MSLTGTPPFSLKPLTILNGSILLVGTILVFIVSRNVEYNHVVQFGDTERREYGMSQVEVERFLGRIITDTDFRIMAENSLEKAACKEGIVLSKEETAILGHIDFSQFGPVAEILDDSIKRASRSSDQV